MGYYPIKCIHCMRSLTMEQRCVKLAPEEIKSFNSRFDKTLDVDINGDAPIGQSNIQKTKKAILYKSLAQLRKENVIAEENILRIETSGEFKNIEVCQQDFVQSIVVKDLDINGEKMSGTVRKFYCPYCHNAIIPMAGKMPMYLVSLMGPSSAGKTVYLTILHMLLSGKNYKLPQGILSFDNLGEMGKEFQNFAFDIRRKNELPSTTQENRKDPYLIRVNYMADPDSGETNKQCLLGLIDMRGEMLSGDHNDDLADFNLPQFKEANGFIMLVDPETLEGVYNRLPEQYFGGRKIEQLYRTIDSMKEAIMECITAEMGKINKPSVVALAKQDILLKNCGALAIELSEPAITPNFRPVLGTDLEETYYEPMNRSTRRCIGKLSGSFTTFLDSTFEKPYYISISALGSKVQIAGNKIDNFEKIQPLRVEEPLLKLLMDFNFIPPFCRNEYYINPRGAMEIWGEKYAEKWSGLPEPKTENKKKWNGMDKPKTENKKKWRILR